MTMSEGWSLEKQNVVRKFLADAETKWPLSIQRNRENAREWVAVLREFDPAEADRFEKLIDSYEKPQ